MTDRIYWLTFRDIERNLNLGVAIVHAQSQNRAIVEAQKLGLHPGGEPFVTPVTKSELDEVGLEFNRLYSRDEMRKKGYEIGL